MPEQAPSPIDRENASHLHSLMPSLHEQLRVQASAEHARRGAIRRGEEKSDANPYKREQAVGAHLSRLERLLDRGEVVEARVWQSAVDELIIDPANIPDSYWESQQQLARDNGLGDITLTDAHRAELVSQLQGAQRTGAESWSTYLQRDEHYPMWFKFYVWDGMSKLSYFDKQKGSYRRRDQSTVAPYPQLNPAALAQVYDTLQAHFAGESPTGEIPDRAKLDQLINSGNFNRLYSYFLLEQKAVIPTPENPADVVGEWRRYTADDIKELMAASEGTPWCIAGEGMANSYLSQPDSEFYLFHLQDRETGITSPTAAASVRLQDGRVVEISGLKGGSSQYLEDSLVPSVSEKVKSLPGGEHYLQAFADKQRLIALDHKFKSGEEFSAEDLRFIYELERSIQYVDTYAHDPRVEEFKQGRDFNADMCRVYDFTGSDAELARTMIESGQARIVTDNLDKFHDLDPNVAARLMIENGEASVVTRNFNQFLSLTSETAYQLIEKGEVRAVIDNLNQFHNLTAELAHQLIENGGAWAVIDNLDKFHGLESLSDDDKARIGIR